MAWEQLEFNIIGRCNSIIDLRILESLHIYTKKRTKNKCYSNCVSLVYSQSINMCFFHIV